MDAADTHDELAGIAQLFPAGEPVSIKVVGYRLVRTGSDRQAEITLEYEFPKKWMLVNVVTRTAQGATTIAGIHANEIATSLEDANRLTLKGKGVDQYTILLMMVIDLALTLSAVVICIKTPIQRKKWLWVLICFVGLARFAVNWTTGAVGFTLLWVGVPPVGANAALFGPWTMYAAVPVGALVFLFLRKSLVEPVEQTS